MRILVLTALYLTLHTSTSLLIRHQATSALQQEDYLDSGKWDIARMQDDGNFVIYKGDQAVWSTGTNNQGVALRRLTLQIDGNVVIYDGNNNSIWSSGNGQLGLVLPVDRNLALYLKSPVWSPETNI